jgi:hypothetical protein
MTKKRGKKLTVRRETVKQLVVIPQADLREVAGGRVSLCTGNGTGCNPPPP